MTEKFVRNFGNGNCQLLLLLLFLIMDHACIDVIGGERRLAKVHLELMHINFGGKYNNFALVCTSENLLFKYRFSVAGKKARYIEANYLTKLHAS